MKCDIMKLLKEYKVKINIIINKKVNVGGNVILNFKIIFVKYRLIKDFFKSIFFILKLRFSIYR